MWRTYDSSSKVFHNSAATTIYFSAAIIKSSKYNEEWILNAANETDSLVTLNMCLWKKGK